MARDERRRGSIRTDGVPWTDRRVQAVLASTALAPLGVRFISPALPTIRDAFAVTDAQASLLISAYFAVGIVCSPLVGLLVDRVGRKVVLVAGLLTFGVVGAAIGLAPTFEVVIALRVLQGIGVAAVFVSTVTIIGDTYEGSQRSAILGVNVAALSAAAALYPVAGGALVGIAWNAPFVAYLAALPVAVFVTVGLPEPERPVRASRLGPLRSAVAAIAAPKTLLLFVATFLSEFLVFGVVYTALPFLLAPAVSPVAIGVVLLLAEVVAVAAAASSGRLARRFPADRLVALGFGSYAVGFLLAWLWPVPAVIAGAVMFVGAGLGLLLPNVDAALNERVSTAERAGAMSLRTSTTFLGRTTGPVAFVLLAVTAGMGYPFLLLVAGGLSVGAATVTLLVG